MNSAHFHLIVNHLPVIFTLVGVIVMIIDFVVKSAAVKRTAYGIFIIGALTSIAAMYSGEGAEEILENLNVTSENLIEIHEEQAEIFSILTYILGGLSLVGLWISFKLKSFSKATGIIIILFAFVVLFFGQQTATTGGELRHTEIRESRT